MTDSNTPTNEAVNPSTASPSGSGDVNAAPATQYEIVNKVTGEVFPVEKLGSGDLDNDMDADFFCKKEDGTEVVFKREGQDDKNNAIFVNDEYVIRSRDTHMALDGVTPVADVVPVVPEAPEKPEGSPAETVVKFNVLDKDGNFVRTYTAEDHGDQAEENAKAYAAKIGGSVQ